MAVALANVYLDYVSRSFPKAFSKPIPKTFLEPFPRDFRHSQSHSQSTSYRKVILMSLLLLFQNRFSYQSLNSKINRLIIKVPKAPLHLRDFKSMAKPSLKASKNAGDDTIFSRTFHNTLFPLISLIRPIISTNSYLTPLSWNDMSLPNK